MDLLHEKAALSQALERVYALKLHLRWFFGQENSSLPRCYNEKRIVSSFVWQADRFFEEESRLPSEKLERI